MPHVSRRVMFDSGLEAHIAAQSVCLSEPLIQSRTQRLGTAQFNLCLACGGGYISYCDVRP